MASRIRSRGRPTDIWPGFVDALAALLVVIIFLLVVFVLAQTFLSQALTEGDEALERLTAQINELGELLSLEREENADLRLNVAQLSASLQQANEDRDDLVLRLGEVTDRNADLSEQVDVLLARAESAEGKLESAEKTVTTDRDSIRAQLSQIESLRRDIEALRRLRVNLELQIAGLTKSLDLSEQTLATAQEDAQGLQTALDTANADSARVRARLDAASSESAQARAALAELETTASNLRERSAEFETVLADTRSALGALRDRTKELEARLDAASSESAQARAALAELERTTSNLRVRSAEFEAGLADSRSALGALRDRTKELEARLATAAERTLLAQKEIEARDVRLAELQALYLTRDSDLEEQRSLSAQASDRVQALGRQVNALRQQLLAMQQALNVAEVRDEEQQIVISSLGERLNRALAARVEELSRYRSEFFGRLREVLGDRQDIQIVGDRFVFQSEVLFNSGSAELEDGGKLRLADLADTLLEISPKIPPEIPWILRVDGHTDAVPIHTAQFPSNWELSSARAISVIQFLMERGIPAGRLAAAGFGQFQPLDDGFDETANRRNRRIELKLTER